MMTNVNTLIYSKKADSEKIARRLEESYNILREMTKTDYYEWKSMRQAYYYDNTITEEEYDAYYEEYSEKHTKHLHYSQLSMICCKVVACQRRSEKLAQELREIVDEALEAGVIVY